MQNSKGKAIKDTISLDSSSSKVKQLVSGAIAGFVSRTCTAPFERTVILQQTRNLDYLGLSIPRILANMVKNEGFLSLWKGNGANVIRIMPFAAIELYAFEFYKIQLIKLFGKESSTDSRGALYLIAGGLSGMTASASVYPLDLARTLFAYQTQKKIYTGILEAWKDIIKTQGIRSLYRGVGATCLGIAPYASLKLASFQTLKNWFISSKDAKPSDLTNFVFGAISGCIAITLTYPTDLLRKRLQIQVMQKNLKTSYIGLIKEIFANEGIRGFYVGLPASYLKFVPLVAITLSVNEKLKNMWGLSKP